MNTKPNTKPLQRFASGTKSKLLLKIWFQPCFPFPSPALTVLGLCRASQRSSFPSKKHLERASYSTALVRPHHSGDSPEISQKMAVTQKPHQCVCSMNPAGEPLPLRRCKISTPSHGVPQPRGQSTPDIQTRHSKADSSLFQSQRSLEPMRCSFLPGHREI